MIKKEEMPACPVATTVQLIGSKWKLLTMRNLLQRPWRFNELQRRLGAITTKTLTQQLRQLEAQQIVQRTVYPTTPPQVEYALTELGQTIQPILKALCSWGKQYQKAVK